MKSLFSLVILAAMLPAFSSCAQRASNDNLKSNTKKDLSKYSQATFAAGCFWHEEALFESVKGVAEAISGYAGGATKNPTYESVETGNTGHAESVMVYYDPSVISYSTLLKVYFTGQDPTQVNRQGPDEGTQYRSIAFYTNDAEKKQIEDYIKQMSASGKYNAPIAVQVMPFTAFWPAEAYNQDYIAKNPGGAYVQHVSC